MAIFRRRPRADQTMPPGTGGAPDMRQVLMSAPPERVRQDLRLMVTRPGPNLGPEAMVWPLGRDLVAVLCVKLPEAAVTVEVPMVRAWGMDAEAAWLTGATNLRHEPVSVQQFDTPEGAPITSMLGQGWPGSAQLTRLGEALGDPLPHGAFVLVPVDNLTLALPVRHASALERTAFLMNVATNLTQGQQPLSTGLFWWYGGRLEELDARFDGGRAQVTGSAEFARVVRSL